MERTLIKDLQQHVGKEVLIKGTVAVARHQGKMAFFDFKDRTSPIQGVVFGFARGQLPDHGGLVQPGCN